MARGGKFQGHLASEPSWFQFCIHLNLISSSISVMWLGKKQMARLNSLNAGTGAEGNYFPPSMITSLHALFRQVPSGLFRVIRPPKMFSQRSLYAL